MNSATKDLVPRHRLGAAKGLGLGKLRRFRRFRVWGLGFRVLGFRV